MLKILLIIRFIVLTKRPYSDESNDLNNTLFKEHSEKEISIAEGLIHLRYSQPCSLEYNHEQTAYLTLNKDFSNLSESKTIPYSCFNQDFYDKNRLKKDNKRIKLESLSGNVTKKNFKNSDKKYMKIIELSNKHDQNIHKNDFKHLDNKIFIYENYKICLKTLALDFETKVYFNLTMFSILFINENFYKRRILFSNPTFIGENELIFLILSVKNSFYINVYDLITFSQKQVLKNDSLIYNFSFLQNQAVNIFKALRPQTNAIKRYYEIYYNFLIEFYKVDLDLKDKNNFIKFSIEDFILFEQNPLLKFLLPEFELFLKNDILETERYFCNRLHFLITTVHFMYNLSKKNIKEEILLLFNNGEKFEILKCKYFFNFIISTKIRIMVLLLRFISKYQTEIKNIITSNFLWLCKLKDIHNENKLSFNTYFLLNFDKIRGLHDKYTYIFKFSEYDSILPLSCHVKINKIPSNIQLNKHFNDKQNFKFLIEKINEILFSDEQETCLLNLPKEKLEDILYLRLIEIIRKEFSI